VVVKDESLTKSLYQEEEGRRLKFFASLALIGRLGAHALLLTDCICYTRHANLALRAEKKRGLLITNMIR